MQIVWISHEAGTGGAGLSLLEAAKALTAAGHSIHALLPARGALADALERIGVPVFVLRYSWWVASGRQRAWPYRLRRLARHLIAARACVALFRQLKPDLVVSNSLPIGPSGAVAALWTGIPHVWYVHELYGSEGHDLFFDLGEAISLSLMDRLSRRIVANSHVVGEQLARRIPREKIRVVYYAVEVPPRVLAALPVDGSADGTLPSPPQPPFPTESLPGENRAFRLVMVARMVPGKRQEDALRAVSLLIGKGLNVGLTLVGPEEPEYGRRLRDLTQKLRIEDRVEFLPHTEDPFSEVVASDVALMCSRGEGFGRVTVEAMKLGRPVIGADSGGTAELIRDGWNGLLYPLGDAEGLARQVERLYHDRALLTVLGRNAQEWAFRVCNVETYLSGLLAAFEEARAASGKGA